jgi:hypothetical protein
MSICFRSFVSGEEVIITEIFIGYVKFRFLSSCWRNILIKLENSKQRETNMMNLLFGAGFSSSSSLSSSSLDSSVFLAAAATTLLGNGFFAT